MMHGVPGPQAETFYQEWRSPSNSRDWREALQIKRSDSSRGFERVGRYIATTLCSLSKLLLDMNGSVYIVLI